ncbi:MAG: hypothetical protein U9P90_04700 [Patescibacteria group bacterium]|nr:hypothetical protein [Patescibacteria group bacterium]
MTTKKVKFKCRHCKKITRHSLPSKNFKLAKEIVQKKGCMYCKEKKLEDITNGYVETKFSCANCGDTEVYELSRDKDEFNNSKMDILAEGCPNCHCYSVVEWSHISSNVVRK